MFQPVLGAVSSEPAAPAPEVAAAAPPNRVFEARLQEFDAPDYNRAIEEIFSAFEKSSGRRLVPGGKRRAGLKVYSDSGPGLRTPPDMVRAVVNALERRGFTRDRLFLIGLNEAHMRACEFLPPLSVGGDRFEGIPVIILESGRFYEAGWFYDSPLPARLETPGVDDTSTIQEVGADRRSYLPVPLLFDVDFWINLPMCSDHPALGVNCALVNATLWNASNTQRFFRTPATAPAAVAEMAAIPEMREGWALNVLSLERYQFIGGPIFNSLYTVSEPLVWASDNPVILDSLMRERIDRERRAAGFRGVSDDLRLLAYGEQLGLGSANRTKTMWVRVDEATH